MSTRLDAAIARLQARGYSWPIAWPAVEQIARSEDCRLTAYECIAGVWTIGWGETSGIVQGMVWTEDQVDARFYQQLVKYAARVEALCTLEPDANQLGAMVSLAYNVGLAGFARSTVLRRHNEGNFQAAARAFRLWNKAHVNGVLTEVAGLTARRAREEALYLESVGDAPRDPMPQAVVSESSLAASPITQASAVTAVGGLATLSQAFDQGKAIADKVSEFVGLPTPALLAGVVIIGALVISQQRAKQRREGWA